MASKDEDKAKLGDLRDISDNNEKKQGKGSHNEKRKRSKTSIPMNYTGLIDDFLREKEIEEKYLKPFIERIRDKSLIPEFRIYLKDLSKDLSSFFQEKQALFLDYFRTQLLKRLEFEPAIKELITRFEIVAEDLHVIPDPKDLEPLIPSVEDLSRNLTRYKNKISRFSGRYVSIGLTREIEFKRMIYKCTVCGTEFEHTDPDHKIGERYQLPQKCINTNCRANRKSDFKLIEEKSESYEIRIFNIADLDVNKAIADFKCIVSRDIEYFIDKVKQIDLEQVIEVMGILRVDTADLYKFQKSEQDYLYYIDVIDITPKELRILNDAIIKEIKEHINKDHDYCNEIIDSIQPISRGIYEYFPGKLICALSFITGDSWDEDKNIRNSLNGIIGSHRGLFKSSMIKRFRAILGISNFGYLQGKNTSDKGLMPTVQRNNKEKDLTKRYGALRYYNRKTLAIDEAQYLDENALECLKCLEEGEITRGLDGTIINAATKLTVILLLNYNTEDEAYDHMHTLLENLGFPVDQQSILDRFDLHYAIPKLKTRIRKILKWRMNKKIINIVSEDVLFNYFMEAKQIYSKGIEIPQDLFHAVDKLDDIIIESKDTEEITTPREFNILLKLLKGVAALRLKTIADDSDLLYIKKHLIHTIIPYQSQGFKIAIDSILGVPSQEKYENIVNKQRIIDMNDIYKKTFDLLTELEFYIPISDHVTFIREFLESNYFPHPNSKCKSSEIYKKIKDFMPKETNQSNHKYRDLLNNPENINYIKERGFIIGLKNNKTHFLKKEKLIRDFLKKIHEIFMDCEQEPLEQESLIQVLEHELDFDRESIIQVIETLVQEQFLIQNEENLLKMTDKGGEK